MITHRLELVDHNLVFVVGAAHPDLNPFYDAAVKVFIQPIVLRLELNKVSEEEQLEVAMRSYAMGVVLESEPPMKEAAVFEWFQNHPGEFDIIVSVVDCRENFTDDDSNEPGEAAPAPEEAVEADQ